VQRTLDIGLEVALEATVENLSLAGLQAVDHRRNRSFTVGEREQDELLVDELGVAQLFTRVVNKRSLLCAHISHAFHRHHRQTVCQTK